MKRINNISSRILLPVALGATVMATTPAASAAGNDSIAVPVAADATTGTAVVFQVNNGATGEPLPGARVTVNGDKATAMTDDNGVARLRVPAGFVELTVEAPGFAPASLGLRSRDRITLSLNPVYEDALPIGQTVADQNVSDLNGQLYAVSRSGVPGAGYAVLVDGIHSINTSSQPLFVVDGQVWQPYENSVNIIEGYQNSPLAMIDPKDIESVKVMRDGSAIYGAKGGNGVVLINTRRARNEATVIEAFANVGIRQKVKSIPMMEAGEYRLYATDVLAGKYPNSSMLDKFNFLNDDPSASSYLNSHADTDWTDAVSRSALLMNYGINVRGGDDRALYAFSFGYTKNDAPIKETSFDRINIRFNSDINLWAGLKLRFDVAFAQATTHMFNDGLDEVSSPYYMSLVKSPLYPTNIYSSTGVLTSKYTDVDELGVGNPLSIIDLAQGESRDYRFNLIASPSYEFNNQWAIRGTVGYIFDKDKENTFLPDYGVADVKLVNNTGETYGTVKQVVRNLMNRRTTFNADLHLEYTPFSDYVNYLSFTGGWRFQNDTWVMSYGQGYNTGSDYVNDLNAADRNLYESEGSNVAWRNIAWYLTGDYSWRNRYSLSVSAVMESSSRFGKDAPGAAHIGGVSWGLFPAVSAAWTVSNEDFLADASWLDLLKLRLSYAVTGNDNLPISATSTYFTSVGFIGNTFGYTLANIGNEKLKWETTGTARLAVDAALFNNRLALTLEGYLSTTDNLLMAKQLKDVAGIESYWTNGGSLRNRGVNFSATVRAVNDRDWKLDIGASIGAYRNKVTKLDDGAFITGVAGGQVLTAEGNPVGVFYGYRTDGVYATADEAAASGLAIRNADGTSTPFHAGDMRFVDNVSDGYINDADRVVIGDPNPDFFGNVNFRLNWRNFTLSTMFTYSVGNDVYNALRANLESGSDIFNQTTALNNRWRANGQVTDIPRATYGDPMGNSRFSDRWIEDGSYLKWKSLSLSYNLPIHSNVVNGLTFTVSMSNLLTWTKYLGGDPEFYTGATPLSMGVDTGLLPASREFNFGVKINL